MSEYWKSTPKYWCKHCSIYVKDTPFERKQHENTGKHQGNLKRFLRGIQNDHERNEREKQKVKDEVERLNKVVGGPSTISAATPASTRQTNARKAPSSALTMADQKRQWAQLADMGIAIPDGFRGEMAIPGDWQTVAQDVITEENPEESLSKGVRKRKLDENEGDEEDVSETAVRRVWGSSTRKYPGKVEEPDLDSLLSASFLKKDRTEAFEAEGTLKKEEIEGARPEIEVDVNHQRQYKRSAEADEKSDAVPRADSILAVKVEDPASAQPLSQKGNQDMDAPMFKKRKARAK